MFPLQMSRTITKTLSPTSWSTLLLTPGWSSTILCKRYFVMLLLLCVVLLQMEIWWEFCHSDLFHNKQTWKTKKRRVFFSSCTEIWGVLQQQLFSQLSQSSLVFGWFWICITGYLLSENTPSDTQTKTAWHKKNCKTQFLILDFKKLFSSKVKMKIKKHGFVIRISL